MVDDDLEGVAFLVQQFDRNLFDTDVFSVPSESVHVMPNRIREQDESHRNRKVTEFRQFEYYQRVSRFKVTIHPSDVPVDSSSGALIIRERDVYGIFRLRSGTRVIIIDGKHCHDAML